MLDCVYNHLYLDELDNLEEFDPDVYVAYRNYLSRLRKQVTDDSPDRITLY